MAIYLLQLGLTDARFSAILPSKRAAAAFWLARKLLLPASVETWNRSLSWYTTYSENEILPVFSMVAKMCVKAPEARFQVRLDHVHQILYRFLFSWICLYSCVLDIFCTLPV